MDLKEQLLAYVENNPNTFARYLHTKPELYALVKDLFGRTVSEKVYSYLHPGIRENHLTCKTCGGPTDEFITTKRGYRVFCSNKCSMSDPEQKAKATAGWKTGQAKNARRMTLFERYGTDAMAIVHKDKIKQVSMEKYGVDNPLKSPLAQGWRESFFERKYGVKNPFQDPTIQAKIKQIMMERYGVESPLELVDWSKINVTKPHLELIDLCRTLLPTNTEIRVNDRKVIAPLELDIYIPSKRLAIEFNELHWHSERGGNKDESYHLSKTEQCLSLGIKLIHLFSDEWFEHREIVAGRLKTMLGAGDRIYARACELVEVSASEEESFLTRCHIQGPVKGSVRLGLAHHEKLVALMTFSKSRFSKEHDWEMLRYCSELGTVVVGGASRLLSKFKVSHSGSIISYADRRWSSGMLYRELGFKLLRTSKPSYYYILPDGQRMNRVAAQKHRLPELLGEQFDPALTEVENMQKAGYDRVFDCGSYVFELEV